MEKSVVITYETLYELLRREKYRAELQQLDKTFFSDVSNYLSGKKKLLDAQQARPTPFSLELQKTQKQYENVQKIIKELYEKRENKIIQLALFSSKLNNQSMPQNMLAEEEALYRDVMKILDKYREEILFNLLEPKLTEEPSVKDTKMIRFTSSIPKFVGDDLKTYGPYEGGDVAEFSLKIADLLIKKGRAMEVLE